MIPQKTSIDPKLHRKLIEAQNRLHAVQQSMQMFQAQCEQRIATIRQEVGDAWKEIAEKQNLDMQNVVWEPHPVEPAIIPTQMKLKQS